MIFLVKWVAVPVVVVVAGSKPGLKPGFGASCTKSCWPNSMRLGRLIGHALLLIARMCGHEEVGKIRVQAL